MRAIGRAGIETAPRPRVPSFQDAPKAFTTAFVAVVLPGRAPSPELLERTNAIRRQWITYWKKVTGGVSTMSTRPNAAGGGIPYTLAYRLRRRIDGERFLPSREKGVGQDYALCTR